jgi:Putative prokaryotic signal transducing protein
MPLHDPVAVYTARTNTEAQIVRHLLIQSGVEAYAVEDLSVVGLWMGGTIPGIHNPKIWVDRADVERAVPILREYEQRTAERRLAEPASAPGGSGVEAICDECGARSVFDAEQRGTVQECPHCNAYMDVGADEPAGEWQDVSDEEAADD